MKKKNRQKRMNQLTNSKRLCEIFNLKQKMDKLYEEFEEECEVISKECEADGLPSYGSTYELRVENAWIWYEEEIDYIANRINQLGGTF